VLRALLSAEEFARWEGLLLQRTLDRMEDLVGLLARVFDWRLTSGRLAVGPRPIGGGCVGSGRPGSRTFVA
jgi:hypothetical protein